MKNLLDLQMFNEPDDSGKQSDVEDNQKPSTDNQQDQDKKYTDDDVDKIINSKFAKWEEEQKKKVDEATKLAEMDAQQKAEYKAKQLEEKLEKLTNAQTLSQMSKTARTMLSEHDINISDDLLSLLVSANADKTKASIDSFVTLFEATVENAVKDKLKGSSPKKGQGNTITRDEILKISNSAERQRLIAENLDLFK
ncbi:MAG: DUF4355 domain-containing protein [Longicatena sp.]